MTRVRVLIVGGGSRLAVIAQPLTDEVELVFVRSDAEAVPALDADVVAVVAQPPFDRPAFAQARAATPTVACVVVSDRPDCDDLEGLPPNDLAVPSIYAGVRLGTIALRSAIAQARGMRERLESVRLDHERALRGALRALSRAFATARPASSAACARVHRIASAVAAALGIAPAWPIEMAALIYQLGALAVPPLLLERAAQGLPLDPDDAALLQRVTTLTEEILVEIPDAEPILDIVHWRERDFRVHRDAIPIGARVLRAAADFDALLGENSTDVALGVLVARAGAYDPAVLDALGRLYLGRDSDAVNEVREVDLDALVPGVVVVEDVLAANGMVLVRRGHPVTQRLIALLRNFAPGGVRLPLRVAWVEP